MYMCISGVCSGITYGTLIMFFSQGKWYDGWIDMDVSGEIEQCCELRQPRRVAATCKHHQSMEEGQRLRGTMCIALHRMTGDPEIDVH
jgi:hypothetical protein